jgi:large subunit ribosomal protein L21
MYAVIETGGKQYRVEVGTELEVELLDAEPGKTVTVDRVLLVVDGEDASIGRPVVDGASVSAEVVRQGRGEKVIAFKYRPKARRRVKKGHRQELTVLRVNDITLNGKSAAKVSAKATTDAKTERQRLEEAAAAQAAKDAELAAKLASTAKTPSKAAPKPKAEAKPKAEPASKPRAAAKPAAKAEPAKAEASAAKADASTAKATPTKKPTTRTRSSGTTAAKSDEKPASGKSAAKPRTTKKDS